ncbi:MAG TPA: T9SS type A sorting domain-containing protein, partial [Ignavibacteriaceae bacterium]|nr:T9SS type A sorting domain-containing protein [Ignavibacteriaceae bacterium]
NYPNPFNPATTISFSLPKSGYVSLKVYNALAQEVATLVNGVKEAGNHRIDFNAVNLNSGIYFYKLETGDISQVKKMTLIK